MPARAEPPTFGPCSQSRPDRRDLLREGWKDIGKVFIIAVVLDVVYALIVHRWIFPGQALLVGTVLAIVPYVLIRGPVTRIVRRVRGA